MVWRPRRRLHTLERNEYFFMAKRIVLKAIKIVAGTAAVVFWLMPLSTGTQFLLFAGSIVVLLICFALSSNLDDEHTGFWPSKPKE